MVNKVILVGNLGKDPVLKRFSDTNAIAEFSLATSEKYRDKDGNIQTITDWHNVKINFTRLAETAEKYLKKGSKVYIEGKLRTREYDKDGQKRYVTEVIAETFQMLDKKEDGGSGNTFANNNNTSNNSTNTTQSSSSNFENTVATAPVVDDDLPF
jgi:single-strand DNA-binding protein